MGLIKTENFTTRQNRIAAIAKVLGHPARVAILEYIIEHQACICGDLVEELPLAQATVSQHLKELKAVGLIKGEIEGTRVCYCIDDATWQEAQSLLQSLFAAKVQQKDCC